MKLAFLTRFDLSAESGVLKKILNQIKSWESQGHHVALFAQTHSDKIWEGLKDIEVHYVESEQSPRYSGLAKYLARFSSMGELMRKLDSWQPDAVFYRFTTHYPSISKMMDKHPFILEINTDDIEEYRLKFGKLKNLYHRTFRHIMLKKAKGMIMVTDDLAEKFNEFPSRKIVVANSINLQEFAPLSAPNNDKPRLFFIGTANREWHGVDKILKLAELRPQYDFDLVGPSNDGLGKIPDNVTAHGFLPKEEYNKIIAKADVALGSFAFHRIPLVEACPLKVREYLAHGIPTIVPYKDTDFMDKKIDLLLELPNSPENVESSLEAIDQFIENVKGRRIARSQISFIDSDIKEKQKVDFILNTVNFENKN